MDFHLSLLSEPPEALATLRGDLDLASSPLVGRRLRQEVDAGCRRLLLDLAAVTFVDATALGMLTQTRRALHEHGGSMEFVAFGPTFLRLCRATGLAEHFGLTGADPVTPAPA